MPTVEEQVAALTTAVDANTAATIAARAGVDAKAVEAANSASAANADRLLAEGARTDAQAAALSAQQTASTISTADLNAAARRIVSASDVVDVFIYDTSKDTDGGAWRYKVGHTSWMQEALGTATRGSRAIFPSKALIVARAASVTIYDLDDPACPMWMVFNAIGGNWLEFGASIEVSGSIASNGILYVGTNKVDAQGLKVIDFIADGAYQHQTTATFQGLRGVVSERNAGLGVFARSDISTIVNNTVNDVAATVLPGSRPNPERLGLPNPTVAVATAGGVSVIHADGVVRNSANTGAVQSVSFDETGLMLIRGGTVERVRPQALAAASWSGTTYTAASAPAILGTAVVAA